MGQSLMWPWNMYLTCEVVIFYQGCNFPLWNSYRKYIIVLIIFWVHQKLVSYMSGHMRLNYMQKKHILIWSKVIWTWPKRFLFSFFLNLRLWMTYIDVKMQFCAWVFCIVFLTILSALIHSVLCALVMLTLLPQIQVWSRTLLPILLYIL